MPPGGLPFLFRQEKEERSRVKGCCRAQRIFKSNDCQWQSYIICCFGQMLSCCGARHLHRRERLPHLPTAATRSARFIRHRRRSHRSPLDNPPPPIRWYFRKIGHIDPKAFEELSLSAGRGRCQEGAALIAGAINSAPLLNRFLWLLSCSETRK